MRVIRKIAKAIVLFGFPASFVSGCASSGPGSAPLTPAASAALPPQSASTQAIGVQAPTTTTAQWPQFGYNAEHDGYNPLETTITPTNVSTLQVAWNNQTIVQPGGIAVDNNVAYVDDMGQSNAGLYALNTGTGAQKWYANVNLNGSWGAFSHAVAAVTEGVVVTPCSNGSSSSFLTGLCGVNAITGKILWTHYCSEYQGNPCPGLTTGTGTSPAVYNKVIYFQSVQGVNEQPDTQALDPKTGNTIWDVAGVYHCPDGGDGSGNPLPAANGLVFAVMACQGTQGATEICALSATTGSAAWCDNTADISVENLIASNGKLYVTEPGPSNNLIVLALNAQSGAQLWSASLPGANNAPMAATGTSLFVEAGGAGVFALSASTGRTLWSYTANSNLFKGGAISVADGIVYTDGGGGNNGNVALAAFNAKSGSLIWTSGSTGNGAAQATPVIVNGRVYAGCYTVCSFALSSSSATRKI